MPRLLNPARRWALRELKLRPGHAVLLAGAPVMWTVDLVREHVGDAGMLTVVEGDPARAAAVVRRGWENVRVLADLVRLPEGAERAFIDDRALIADAAAVERLLAPLGPAARVAVACRRGDLDGLRAVEARVHALRRERFYLGAAQALWGQLP